MRYCRSRKKADDQHFIRDGNREYEIQLIERENAFQQCPDPSFHDDLKMEVYETEMRDWMNR